MDQLRSRRSLHAWLAYAWASCKSIGHTPCCALLAEMVQEENPTTRGVLLSHVHFPTLYRVEQQATNLFERQSIVSCNAPLGHLFSVNSLTFQNHGQGTDQVHWRFRCYPFVGNCKNKDSCHTAAPIIIQHTRRQTPEHENSLAQFPKNEIEDHRLQSLAASQRPPF